MSLSYAVNSLPVVTRLKTIFADLLHMAPAEVDVNGQLLELGADSLILVEVIRRVETEFNVKLSIRQLFEELLTISAVAEFLEKKYTPSNCDSASQNEKTFVPAMPSSSLPKLQSIIAELLHLTAHEIPANQPLLELGADSLILVELIRKVQNEYNVKLSVRQLFEELLTVSALAEFIDQQVSINSIPETRVESISSFVRPEPVGIHNNAHHFQFTDLNDSQQLQQVHSLLAQVQSLMQNVVKPAPIPFSSPANVVTSPKAVEETSHWQLEPDNSQRSLTATQQEYLQAFTKQYLNKTKGSKSLAQQFNHVLCNSRRSFAMLREQTLPLFYTIHAKHSAGSKFWDVDENEYLDIAMGFGVHLFGHNPEFLTKALAEQLRLGLQLGPENANAGEVAQLLKQLTGMERFAFCNTGTEAIMTAMRIARAATGRKKIVLFKNAYHGHFDGTLALPDINNSGNHALPMALGTPAGMVADLIILDFNTERALNYLQEHGHELAAVVVEPVQNRRPDLQAIEFLKKLSTVTKEKKTILIFDEILVGFRIHQRGAQAWAGVKADIAIYAKIIGGGLPIAVIGGNPEIMSYVDGGVVDSNNQFENRTETTYTAGTYIKNPLALAAARAILRQILQEGPSLQEQLNLRCTQMISKLNALFKEKNVSFNVSNFGSFFRFSQAGNLSFIYRPLELDLFVYHMIYHGVYIWEGGTCFLSTAHTDTDIDNIIAAAAKSIDAMLKGGFFK